MPEYCYDGACGGIITERWRGDMQDLSCNRGYGMMCEGGTYAEELCKDCPMNQVFLTKDNDFHF